MRWRREQLLTVAAGLLPLIVSAIVFRPITRSYFFADDFFNFVRIVDSGWLRYLFIPMAGHVVLVRALVNCLHYAAFGLNASPYFWFVLANHLLNVGLTFCVLRQITRRRDLAMLGALIWGASPVYVETLTWYAACGVVMSLTATLLVLAILLRSARAPTPPRLSTALGCSLLLLAGATCYGTGLALAIATPVALLFLVPSLRPHSRARTMLLVTPVLAIGLYLGLRHIATVIGESTWIDEGVMRVALSRFDPVPHMFLHLVRFGLARVLAGAWLTGAVDPGSVSWGVLAAVTGLVVLAIVRSDARTRAALVAVLGLCAASYGVIALGRANSYAVGGIAPAVAASTLRYHYVGSQPLVMLLVVLLGWIAQQGFGRLVTLAAAGMVIAQGWALATHPIRFVLQGDARTIVTERLAKVEAEIRRAPASETLSLNNEHLPAAVTGLFGPELVPGTAALILIAHGGDRPLGHDVRFVEPNERVRSEYHAPRSRWLSHLLVQPRVTVGGDHPDPNDPPCELRLINVQLRIARALLACERRSLVKGFDVIRCRDAVMRVGTHWLTTPCRACANLAQPATQLRLGIERARWWLRCVPDPGGGDEASAAAQQCGRPSIRALDQLLRSLFACHRQSIARDQVLDDEDCEQRASAVHEGRLAAIEPTCGDCNGRILRFGAWAFTGDAIRGIFCYE